jgi:hypothetical protein
MFRRIPRPPLIIAGITINQDVFVPIPARREWTKGHTVKVGDHHFTDTDEAIFNRLAISLQINRHVPEFWDDWAILDLNEHLADEDYRPPLNVSDELWRLRHRPMPWAIHDGG